MPYNCKGDLYKIEIVKKLQGMGFDVKSVNALNKIMEKMGLLIHYGNGWGTTDAGAKFSMWHKGVLNSDAWHPELVDEIAKFLKEKLHRHEKRLAVGANPVVGRFCVKIAYHTKGQAGRVIYNCVSMTLPRYVLFR